MLNNVKVYFREEGKLVKYNVDYVESYSDAIALIRAQVFRTRGAIMALVQKGSV
jgi:hypothetical protein